MKWVTIMTLDGIVIAFLVASGFVQTHEHRPAENPAEHPIICYGETFEKCQGLPPNPAIR